MRQLTCSLLLLCACLPLATGEADPKKRVKQTAQAMADALLDSDYEKFTDYVRPNNSSGSASWTVPPLPSSRPSSHGPAACSATRTPPILP
jgi:hypothetical protein